jgi:hypothetical protein
VALIEPTGNDVAVALLKLIADGVPRFGVVKAGDEANTTAPVPVTAEIAVPLILKTLPVPAVSNVLFVWTPAFEMVRLLPIERAPSSRFKLSVAVDEPNSARVWAPLAEKIL